MSVTGFFCGLLWSLGTGHVLFLVQRYRDLWVDYKRRERAEAKRLGLPEPKFGMLFE